MSVFEFLENLKGKKDYKRQIVWQESLLPRKERFGKLNFPLNPLLEENLKRQGIHKLYLHQTKAINLIREGKNVVIQTGTASGKSLCYNIPILESLLENRKNTALCIFPTKALAQDQLKALNTFSLKPLVPATYDGDTPDDERALIRRNANLILTNFDMLHLGILPNHKMWGDFFLNLKFVVVDEMHTLRGVFGSNVAHVLRRSRRICAHYGSSPQFILTSATIANPKEHAEKLINQNVKVVDEDGSPQARKDFLFWNPPYLDVAKERRRSSSHETTQLLVSLIRNGLRTIVFSKSRQAAELIYKYAKGELKEEAALLERISSYRAGYLAPERREIERRLFSGELLGVSSTNALELGIDIGDLDACVINGFPGTIASTWQQAGRAGRRSKESLAVLVAQDDPLDQYYMKFPRAFFGKSHEKAIINPKNPVIFLGHLKCSAYEIPLVKEDEIFFGEKIFEAIKSLVAEGILVERKRKYFWSKKKFPAEKLNIRSSSQNIYSIVDLETGNLLGTADSSTAFIYLYPGAIYLHQGDSYLVTDLDLHKKIAFTEKTYADYYTQPREDTTLEILQVNMEKEFKKNKVFFGVVDVTTHVTHYQKRKIFSSEVISVEELNLPPQRFVTEAFWFNISERNLSGLKLNEKELAGGIHAMEHAAIGLLPVYAMCDRWDIGGVSTPFHPQVSEPTIFIYDGYAGGIGIALEGYKFFSEIMKATLDQIKDCGCKEGCPSCIQSPKCGNWNEPLNKKTAVAILKNMLF